MPDQDQGAVVHLVIKEDVSEEYRETIDSVFTDPGLAQERKAFLESVEGYEYSYKVRIDKKPLNPPLPKRWWE